MLAPDSHKQPPFHEPITRTLARTFGIAVVVGGVYALTSPAGVAGWLAAAVTMTWPSFGGHWVELWFINWLSPRLPDGPVQSIARLLTWFVGGSVLAVGMALTARTLGVPGPLSRLEWWAGGLGFVGLELIVHLGLLSRGAPSFYRTH
jgi:hypothetical protein